MGAGRRGGFGLVVAVDRSGRGSELVAHGADVVVRDLTGIEVTALADGRGASP